MAARARIRGFRRGALLLALALGGGCGSDPPYARDGGAIEVDSSGDPVIQRMEALRFAVSVPRGTMPAAGWPIVLYAHGTGGDYRSFIDNETALVLAAQGLAVISIDQPLHGTRAPPGSATEDAFFNYQNPIAGRDHVRQHAEFLGSLATDGIATLDP